jgi:thiol-disulfide isomerase/thioredoxin
MSTHAKAPKKQRQKGFSRTEKIAGIVILVVAIWAVYSFTQPPPPQTTTTITTPTSTQSALAPDFTLSVVGPNGLTGQKLSLSSFRGKVVFLEFMEPWCSICQRMAPTIDKLYQEYGRQNVVFLSVAGPSSATVDDVAKFIRDYGTDWTYVYDSSGTIFATYGVSGTPTFFLIAKNGSIATRYEGLNATYEILAADLTRLNS